MKTESTNRNSVQLVLRIVFRIVVHIMALILLISAIKGLFFNSAYEVGKITAEDQNHLRVFWVIPILASLGIHYALFTFYKSKDYMVKEKSKLLLRGIATWMLIAAVVRLFSILVLGDPTPRLVPIIVEFAFFPLLLFLSSDMKDKTNANTSI